MLQMDSDKQWSFEAFNDSVDPSDLRREWEEWLRAFELVLELKNIESQHDKLVFMLARGGRGLQRIYYNLRPVASEIYPEPVKIPRLPKEIPEYDNAVKRLSSFFIGKRNERVELEVFRSLKQTADETFNQFILKLRTQAARCDFQDREEREILQQVTMGAKDERVRDKGLENMMNLDELTNYAINREILAKQKGKQNNFGAEHGVSTISYVKQEKSSGGSAKLYGGGSTMRNRHTNIECERCGSWKHRKDSRDCYARNARCNNCGVRGHFSRKCSASGQAQRSGPFKPRPWKRHSEANTIREECYSSEGPVRAVRGSPEDSWKVLKR